MNPALIIAALGGILALGLLASAGQETIKGAAASVEAWVDELIEHVSMREAGGRYDSMNRNTDGAGLSFGLIQWAQRPGSLGELLQAFYTASPSAFRSIFGPSWQELLEATAAPGIRPVDGAHLWKSPWVERFKAAGAHPTFQAVQRQLIREGAYLTAARRAARTLGVETQRGVALAFSTAVQQGAAFAERLAEKVAYKHPKLSPEQRLTVYARMAPAHFRRAQASPPPAPKRPSQKWQQVSPGEWHLFAVGERYELDLYLDVLHRRMAILKAPHLSDQPVNV